MAASDVEVRIEGDVEVVIREDSERMVVEAKESSSVSDRGYELSGKFWSVMSPLTSSPFETTMIILTIVSILV